MYIYNGTILYFNSNYSKSFLFGFLDGSFDRKPNVNKETKKITTVYTRNFNANISKTLIT